ncbi:Proclotting enzyme [Orchesella cincta]|uniref:Proclotting enzyme n=1 Tax=Orchesella cincta TaxID=48709 RepID=A0A1D2MVS4_ORCCI|nr:Proclotting enzyme [Orchesella cincta]
MMMPGPGGPYHVTFQASPIQQIMDQVRPRHIQLPPMQKVTETLGALGTIARQFLRRNTGSEQKGDSSEAAISTSLISSSSSSSHHHHHDLFPAATSSNANYNQPQVFSTHPLKIKPEEDEQLLSALYTLGRNVLGQNVTDTLVPMVKTMNHMGRFLPPLIYRDGRIILGTGNSTKDGGNIQNVVCTTPSQQPGRCLDISGCPSLLLDLQRLRKSLCFKALFVPGVCCPDRPENEAPMPSKPNFNTGSTSRPRPITVPTTTTTTTKRPSFTVDIITATTSTTTTTTVRPTTLFGIGGANEFPSRDCGRAETPSFRIVGGEKSTPGMFPWMAAIFLHGPKGTEFWCGGTLIGKRMVLTAAHCSKDAKQRPFSPRQFTVRLGDYDLVRTDDPSSPESYRVIKITAHPQFNGVGFYNDVALLELERDVQYSRFISPICLPTARNRFQTFEGTYPTVIGWGTNKYGGREHNALQEVKLPVWSNSDCDRAYFQPITNIFLCAGYPQGGKDACQGDSGGPLMLEMDGRWTQIGIVSFGNRCAEAGYPGVYTRLTEFLDWINANA